jgi:hypothetical protein
MNPASDRLNGSPRASAQVWKGRDCLRLANGRIACTLLRQGCVVADVRLLEADGQESGNLVWESPWLGPDTSPDVQELIAKFGDVSSGRYLQHYTGHVLCLDGFGPASEEEFAQGSGLHGEAIQQLWRADAHGNELRLEADLPLAALSVGRRVTLLPGEAVLRVNESVTNRGSALRNVHWVQHATVGTPAFGPGARIATSACEGLTWPLGYEDSNALIEDAAFEWPHAPGPGGKTVDLSDLFSVPRSGFVAAVKQPTGRRVGFVAAHDTRTGLVLAYMFRCDVFPWVTLWEENRCRMDSPWHGEVQARGLEFGATAFPLGNDAVDAHGPVLGTRTSHPIPAGSSVTAPWLIAAARLPLSWPRIDDLYAETDALVFCCGAERFRIPAAGIASFLGPEGGSE